MTSLTSILSLGGSLGALKLNQAWQLGVHEIMEAGIQLVWQCGKRYYEQLKPQVMDHPNLKLLPFIAIHLKQRVDTNYWKINTPLNPRCIRKNG